MVGGLAYRRVPLHSEVSCRCELTGGLCSSPTLLFCRCYHCEPLAAAAARTCNNAIAVAPIRHRVHNTANELNHFRAATCHRIGLPDTRMLPIDRYHATSDSKCWIPRTPFYSTPFFSPLARFFPRLMCRSVFHPFLPRFLAAFEDFATLTECAQ